MVRCDAAVLLGAMLSVSVSAQRTDLVRVDTIVSDVDGHPIAGAEFADLWDCVGGHWQGTMMCQPADQKGPLRSDAEGRLRGTWIRNPFGQPLFGRSSDGGLVAVVAAAETATHELVVSAPLVLWPARVLCGEVKARGVLRLPVRSMGRAADLPNESRHWLNFTSDEPRFRLPLPPGVYQVAAGVGYSHATTRTVVLTEDRPEVDMGPITILWRPFDLPGEVLPDWEIASAVNIAPERATLAALRGQPLLVVFDEWGTRFRPEPELRQGVAALGEHARRDAFRVVLFDTSMRPPGWPETPPNEPVVERRFALVRPVPSHSADTLYGCNQAIVVLDRDGRLVHCGRVLPDALAALERLLSPARSDGK